MLPGQSAGRLPAERRCDSTPTNAAVLKSNLQQYQITRVAQDQIDTLGRIGQMGRMAAFASRGTSHETQDSLLFVN